MPWSVFRNLRRINQVVFLVLFFALVTLTTARSIASFPVEWFLGLDPLVALSVGLAGHNLHSSLVWAVLLALLTLVFGRFFCGFVCPFGTLHHAVGFLGRARKAKTRMAQNAPRRLYITKYFILFVFIGMAALGSTQIGLLDPIAFTWRAMATVVAPVLDWTGWYQGLRHFHGGAVIAVLFFGALALNWFWPRLFCRMLCPLGALLGLLSRFSLFRLQRDRGTCRDCQACNSDCQGAAEPSGDLKPSECMLCLNCTVACKHGNWRYDGRFAGPALGAPLDLGRRRIITAFGAGVVSVPLLRVSGGSQPRPNPACIRPPGALPEKDFLERCIKCGACIKACPTGGLQPALGEAGIEGLWTPVLMPRLGHCEQSCVLCGRVCPTGAIRALQPWERVGRPPEHEPVRIGLAVIDRGRCLPWGMDTPCIVCEEVCPTAPKAIYYRKETITNRHGEPVELKRPYVDPNLCVGCGMCEARCPVFDQAAIRVSSVGETRNPTNRILLAGDV